MQDRPAFGRRTTAFQGGSHAPVLPVRAPSPSIGRSAPAEAPAAPDQLSPEAEAFRREMRDGPKGADAQFTDWRRSQQFGGILMILLRLALMTPGGLCFVLHAPSSVSFGLEITGFVLGWWVKRARKRYIRTIVDWKDPMDGSAT